MLYKKVVEGKCEEYEVRSSANVEGEAPEKVQGVMSREGTSRLEIRGPVGR